MVRFWSDPKDIKIAIMETMAEFANRPELAGWIKGNESINSGAIAEELAKLVKENSFLKEQLSSSQSITKFNGITFDEMLKLLTSIQANDVSGFVVKPFSEKTITKIIESIQEVVQFFGDSEQNLLHYYWVMSRMFNNGIKRSAFQPRSKSSELNQRLHMFGLTEKLESIDEDFYKSTEGGKQFLLRLRLEMNLSDAERYIA